MKSCIVSKDTSLYTLNGFILGEGWEKGREKAGGKMAWNKEKGWGKYVFGKLLHTSTTTTAIILHSIHQISKSC